MLHLIDERLDEAEVELPALSARNGQWFHQAHIVSYHITRTKALDRMGSGTSKIRSNGGDASDGRKGLPLQGNSSGSETRDCLTLLLRCYG
jgi:hypothetical protein